MFFFHSLPVPELREWFFSIPFPFLNFGNGINHYRFRMPKSRSRSPIQMLPEFLLERWWSYLDEVLEAIWSVMSRWRLPPLVQPPPRLPTCPSWISGRIWGGAVRATSTCLGHYWPRYSLPSPLLTHLHWQPIALMQPSLTSATQMISNLGNGFIFPWGWETR